MAEENKSRREAIPNQALRKEREDRGWTQAYVAERIGLSDYHTIGKWERGVIYPSPYWQKKLCTLYNKSEDELHFFTKRVIQKKIQTQQKDSPATTLLVTSEVIPSTSSSQTESVDMTQKGISSPSSQTMFHQAREADGTSPSPSVPFYKKRRLLITLLAFMIVVGTSLGVISWLHPPGTNYQQSYCLGTDFPTSGTEANTGIPTRNGADLAIVQNYDLGSGYTLSACDKDDVSPVTGIHDPDTGVRNVRQFINDRTVLAFVGPGNSNVAQFEIPLAAQAGLPMVSPNTAALCLTLQQYCTNPRQVHPPGVPNFFFRICSNNQQQGQAANLLFKSLGLRTAFVVDDTEMYGRELADTFIQYLKKDGGTLLGHDQISKDKTTAQLAQLAQKIVSPRPDAVFYAGVTSNGGGHLKMQLVQAGFTGPLIGGAGMFTPTFLNDASSDANNTYAIALGPDPSTLPQLFTQAYERYYGAMPGQYSAYSYDAAMVLIIALKSLIKTNPQMMHGDVETIRRAVQAKVQHPEQPHKGVTGPITFDSNGDNAARKTFLVYAVENGQWIPKPTSSLTFN